MRIGIIVNTPAQLHFYKNICKILMKKRHFVSILYRDYGETAELVKELNINAHLYHHARSSKLGKISGIFTGTFSAVSHFKIENIDLVTGFGVFDAFSSFFINKPVIVFTDSEPSSNPLTHKIQFKFFMPFINNIITPHSFREDLGKKHIRVNSYKELAYLHPNYYQPHDNIFELLGIEKGEEYALLRFNAFDAVHDAGIKGFSREDKITLVRELEKHMRVFISSESGVPDEIKDRVLKIPKSRIHDTLYFAKLCVTDTQTMATEAAILGTPVIRCNSFVGKNDMGNFIELERKYGLMFNYNDSKIAIEKAIELAKDSNAKKEWAVKRERLLKDKIDMTEFMVWFIENYPNSVQIAKSNFRPYWGY